jgi:hypothetical protein
VSMAPGVTGNGLIELVQTIYPAPHTVWLPQASADQRPRATVAEFLLVPHARRPRLAIPVQRAQRMAAVRHLAAPRPLRARLRRAAVHAAAAGPGTTRLAFRDRIYVVGPADGDSLPAFLSRALGTPISLCLHIGGGLRANRKPVVAIFGPDGVPMGFAKLSINELTTTLVRAETAALRRLQGADLRLIVAPEVRLSDRWRSHEVLVQSPLPVWQRSAPVAPTQLVRAMRELAGLGRMSHGSLATSRYRDRLAGRLDAMATAPTVANRGVREQLRQVGLQVLSQYGETGLEFGTWHGDWSPWNMHVAGGRIYLWDWERFGDGVPLGFDALHFEMNAALGRGMAPRQAADLIRRTADDLLGPFRVGTQPAAATAALYLVDVATRYLADRQDESGQALGAVADWALPVINETLR